MSAADRLASTVNAIDRLPRAVRRAAIAAVPLALLGALVTAFALAPRHRDAQRPRARHASGAEAARAVAPPRVAPVRPDRSRSTATQTARRFLRAYLAYSYGRAGLHSVRGADPQLMNALRRARPRVPPAARRRPPRITTIQVLEQARGALQATATITDGHRVPYALVVYLDRRPGGWTVTRLGDD